MKAVHALPALVSWLAASLLALLLAAAWLLDGPDDHRAEWAQAHDLQAALHAEQARARFERAASAICGQNAAWMELEGGAIRCIPRHGRAAGVLLVGAQP